MGNENPRGAVGAATVLNEPRKEKANRRHTRIGIEFRVEGEAKFLSHHDMMRCLEYAVGRAKLPVAFSEGFNPRPKLSIPLPRPVGVASWAELLVLRLTEAVDGDEVRRRLTAQAPEGVAITGHRSLEGVRTVQAAAATYELALTVPDAEALTGRITELQSRPSWPCRRSDREQRVKARDLELRELVGALDVDGSTVRFTLVPMASIWARIPEVLDLLAIDSPTQRCRVVRVHVHWCAHPNGTPPS